MLSPLFAGLGCAVDPAADPAEPIDVEPGTIADVRIPTDDGAAMYRFRFSKVSDGPLVTLVESPLGYPEVEVGSECALDTFLRVAPPDMEVPRELLAACGVPQPDGGTRPLRDTDPAFVAGELAARDLELDLQQDEPPRRRCSRSEFDEGVEKLAELASYQPLINTNCESDCELFVAWNHTGCAFYDGEGNFQNNCSWLDHQQLLSQYGPEGMVCLAWGPPDCDQVPNPACDHTEWVIGDWGPYGTWTRVSAGTSRTTKVLTEITNCDREPARAWWQSRGDGSAWSAQQSVSFAGDTTSTLVLSAGWDGNDDWRGWDFRIHAEGNDFHAATAWVELEGRDRFTCPILF